MFQNNVYCQTGRQTDTTSRSCWIVNSHQSYIDTSRQRDTTFNFTSFVRCVKPKLCAFLSICVNYTIGGYLRSCDSLMSDCKFSMLGLRPLSCSSPSPLHLRQRDRHADGQTWPTTRQMDREGWTDNRHMDREAKRDSSGETETWRWILSLVKGQQDLELVDTDFPLCRLTTLFMSRSRKPWWVQVAHF